MKKVEIIIQSVYMKKILEIFKKNGISGYTVIRDIEGCGIHGLQRSDEVTDISSNNYIFTICKEKEFESIREDLKQFIKKYGGKCILSDAEFME
jgi:nitrogen regulatory protein PII